VKSLCRPQDRPAVQLSVAWSFNTPQLKIFPASNLPQDVCRELSINGRGVGGAVKANAAERKRWFWWPRCHSSPAQPSLKESNHWTAHTITPHMTMTAIKTNMAPVI
jgi:hypothetical protein